MGGNKDQAHAQQIFEKANEIEMQFKDLFTGKINRKIFDTTESQSLFSGVE